MKTHYITLAILTLTLVLCSSLWAYSGGDGSAEHPYQIANPADLVKKSLESDYPRPEAVALRPIHGFATAISKHFLRQSQMPLTTPKGRGFQISLKLGDTLLGGIGVCPRILSRYNQYTEVTRGNA